MPSPISPRGRGTSSMPRNRFESLGVEDDAGAWEEIAKTDPDFVPKRPVTQILHDDSQSILSRNQSPDIGFTFSLNPYRGCEHGCAYCYARPYHEYLGFNAGLDFETKIIAKPEAPTLLEKELSKSSWAPTSLACSGVTDCYQPIERKQEITRQCLEILARCRHPVGLITKNALVTRDLDLLEELNHFKAALVVISLTSLDPGLAGDLEPRASRPQARLKTIRELSEAGIPVGVSVAPIIPGLNDHEIPKILEAAAEAGASFSSGTVLRLPFGVKEIFEDWLMSFRPTHREKVLDRVRELRGGRLNSSTFGERMTGRGALANEIQNWLTVGRRRCGLEAPSPMLSTDSFRRPMPGQLELF
ncbi:MAG: PA0069 family radical SAM protein [Verrucomicrobiota bacterium]